jgi:hypothetical protein
MKSQQLGSGTSKVEVASISAHGLWMLVNDKEYLLPYEDFPWFKDARVSEVLEVELLHGFHLHWPRLDIDLEIASLENPCRFPLVYT